MKSYLDLPGWGERYYGPDGQIYVRGQESGRTGDAPWFRDLTAGRPQPPESYTGFYNAAAYNSMKQSALPAASAPAPAAAVAPTTSGGTVTNWAGVQTPVQQVPISYAGNTINTAGGGFKSDQVQNLINQGKFNEAAVQLNLERDKMTAPYFEDTLRSQAEAAGGMKQLVQDYGQGDPIIDLQGIDQSLYAAAPSAGQEEYRQVEALAGPSREALDYGQLTDAGSLVGMDPDRISRAGQSAEDSFADATRQYLRSRAGAPASGLGKGLFFLGKQARSRAEADAATAMDDLRIQQMLGDRANRYQEALRAREFNLGEEAGARDYNLGRLADVENFRREEARQGENLRFTGSQAERDRITLANEEARRQRIADAIAGRDTRFQQQLQQRETGFQRKKGLFQSILGQQSSDNSAGLTQALSGAAQNASATAAANRDWAAQEAERKRQSRNDRWTRIGGALSALEGL